jgi:hypothetical protein
MSRTEAIFPAALMLGVTLLLAGGFAAGYSWTVIAFPLGAGIIVCVLSALQLAWVLAGRASARADNEAPLEPLTFGSLGWVFILLGFIYAFGFVFGPAAYLLAYLRINGSSWALSAIVAISSIVVTWGLFIKFLQVLLPIEPPWMG